MIPFEELCAALDRHQRRLRGEAQPPSPERGILEAASFVVQSDDVTEESTLHGDEIPLGGDDIVAEDAILTEEETVS